MDYGQKKTKCAKWDVPLSEPYTIFSKCNVRNQTTVRVLRYLLETVIF